MKNKLSDLNNHLFAELERLSDEDTKGDALKEEVERAKAITSVAKEIINGANLALRAQIAVVDRLIPRLPPMLENGNSDA